VGSGVGVEVTVGGAGVTVGIVVAVGAMGVGVIPGFSDASSGFVDDDNLVDGGEN
jgi:hypothetical protein